MKCEKCNGRRAAFEYMRNTLKEIRAYSTDITAVTAADEALELVLDRGELVLPWVDAEEGDMS